MPADENPFERYYKQRMREMEESEFFFLQWWLEDDGKTPRRVKKTDFVAFCHWYENMTNRIVRQELVGRYWVSTVYLALDHNHFGKGPPVLWETMLFLGKGGDDAGYQDRYSSYDEALEGHQRAVVYAQMLNAGDAEPQTEEEEHDRLPDGGPPFDGQSAIH